MIGSKGDRATGDLIREVAGDLQLLVRKELELARTELVEGVTAKVKGAGLAAGAFLLVFPALLFLFVALALWLPRILPVSVAGGFLIVSLLMFLFAGLVIGIGIKIFRSGRPGVASTVESVKEDVRWARGHLRS
ncbi:MAG TPA: phage holin family protein [Actinomycetota bacterium]|jgi:hypothetical protein|nr:phage holin family protein [Actinomycetota bacterium]